MEEGDMEGLYDDLEDTDLGEQIHKLERVNEELKTHIRNLESDIARLMTEVVELKKTQKTLTKNISELFKTAQAELQRKDSIIADLRSKLDDVILRRVGRKRPPHSNEQNHADNRKQMRLDQSKNDNNRREILGSRDDKHCISSKNEYDDKGGVVRKNGNDRHTKNTLNFGKREENNGTGGRCDDRHRKLNAKDENHRGYREADGILRRNVARREDRSCRSNSHNFLQKRATEIKNKVTAVYANSDDRRSRSNSRDNRFDKRIKLTDVEGTRSRNADDCRRHDQMQDSIRNLRNVEDMRSRGGLPRLQNERCMKFSRVRGDSPQNDRRQDSGGTLQTETVVSSGILNKNVDEGNNWKSKRKDPEDMEEGEISIIESSGDELPAIDHLSNKIPEGKTSVDKEQFKMAQILSIENVKKKSEETRNIETPRNDNESTKQMTEYQTPQEIPKVNKEQTCSDIKIDSEILNGQQVAICLEYQSLNGANGLLKHVNDSSLSGNNITVGDITNSSLVMSSKVGLNTPGGVNIRRKRRRCVVQMNDD